MDYIFVLVCVFAAIYGLCIGSFLNVVIYRLPLSMSLAKPSSHCPKCKHPIAWYDNIPVLSYLLLGGKCRNCGVHIPFRYTAVEIANGIMWLLCALIFWQQSIVTAVSSAFACSVLLSIFFIDLENMIIPDVLNLFLAICGVISIFGNDGVIWYSRLIGGAVGLAFFGLFKLGSLIILKKDGLGGGDVLLMGAAGLLLGWERLLLAVLFASVVGSVILIIIAYKTKDKDKPFPFAPFLCAGVTISLLFGNTIINWYTNLILGI